MSWLRDSIVLVLAVLVAGCRSTSSAQPVSTTLTVVPTRPAASQVKLGPIHYGHAQISRIQHGAAAGQLPYRYYLQPMWAVSHALPQQGINQPFQIYSPLRVKVRDRGARYDVLLSQPLRSGSAGIWVMSAILAYAPGKKVATNPRKPLRTIRVTHTLSELQRIQEGASHNLPRYVFYRDPLEVVAHNLGHFGVGTRFTIEPRLALVVLKGLESYDVEATQPAVTGPTGIWLASKVEPHIGGDDQG